ncbi:AlpA family phage regulatory protein [Burkholderia cenocepacia]|nr:AlpA family phage regulatory protein [Burkholderia cenocepacia]
MSSNDGHEAAIPCRTIVIGKADVQSGAYAHIDMLPDDALLRIDAVLAFVPMSRSTWDRGVRRGEFPQRCGSPHTYTYGVCPTFGLCLREICRISRQKPSCGAGTPEGSSL